ncbi:rhomboid family intramembrane serine protease [Actinotignum sp. GS-2025b]|uniref:rhomboid family intramembrane serine protease n=1 Tax=Actinotignum sp. GS-2025b TaxID=3427275 RepID=UPI003F44CC82
MHNVPKKRRLQIRKPVPYVTITLIVVNVAVLLAQWLDARVGQVLIFAPGIAHEEPYRFISSTFMHAGFTHLLFNMYALWLIGSVLERMVGWWRFLGLYLLSAVAGNVMVLYTVSTDIDYYTGTVGASGAVFGIFAAMFVVLRRFGGSFTQMAVVIAINLAISFLPGTNISWQSHVGGLLMGALLMAIISRRRHVSRALTARDIAVLLLGAAFLVAAIFFGYR